MRDAWDQENALWVLTMDGLTMGRFYLKEQEAGVSIMINPGYGMVHRYPLLTSMIREATEAMVEIVNFVRIHFNLDENTSCQHKGN